MQEWPADVVERRAVADLVPYARNARTHSEAQVAQLAASIREWGWTSPVLIDEQGGIIAGHGRVLAARKLGIVDVPVMVARGWSEAQKRAYVIADNQLAANSDWNPDLLKVELGDLRDGGFDLDLIGLSGTALAELFADPPPGSDGTDPAGGLTGETGTRGSLAARFGIVPFSVLNAREGWWQDRKRAWLSLGIASEIGRGENLLQMSDTMLEPDPEKRARMANGKRPAAAFGQDLMRGEHVVGGGPTPGGVTGPNSAWKFRTEDGFATGEAAQAAGSGTSIFDPVLCELAYRWFCPPGGVVLDPFAGGSVRGIVAGRLGRHYLGVDLRLEQVEANRAQAERICADAVMPQWRHGDSALLLPHLDCNADLVFTCPPYGDLEVYSDLAADLSTMPHHAFLQAYRDIIAAAVAHLRPDRFAVCVVGDFRDGKGFYRNFVSDTIGAFEDAGAKLYNEAILVTAVGSLALRAGKQFAATRKLGKTHQQCLVFCKGDPARATAAIGEVEFAEGAPEEEAAPAAAAGFGEPL